MPDDALCEVAGCGHPGEAEFSTGERGEAQSWIVCAEHKRALEDGAAYSLEGRAGGGGAIVLTGS